MKLRLALCGALALATLAPLAPSASAWTCQPETQALCIAVGFACNVIDKEKVYDLSCQLG